MRVTRLQVSNVLRIVAIDVTPEGHLVTIGGRNGQGKSSAMNSLAMALGGAALCPPEPIHGDEAEGVVRVDFDTDLVVTRKFNRDKVHQDTCAIKKPFDNAQATVIQLLCDCRTTWSETRSTLSVTNKAGASYPSPQALLNKLYGSLAFDPLAFKDAKDQAAILRAIVKLDVSQFEKARADAASQRAMLKKTLDIKEAQLLELPHHEDAPAEEVSLDVVSGKMLEAERYRKLAEDAEREVEKQSTGLQSLEYEVRMKSGGIVAIEQKIAELNQQLEVAHKSKAEVVGWVEDTKKALDAAQITARSARAVVPDVEVIRAELATTEAMNAKVRANVKRLAAGTDVAVLIDEIAEQQNAIDAADAAKASALRAVKFPVEGLGLTDDGVTFAGLPFSQASSAEQLRVSAAIGFALNPTLKLLLIKNGNLMDEDSVAALAKQAEEAGAQVLVEWVTKDREAVQVFIEDGHVA